MSWRQRLRGFAVFDVLVVLAVLVVIVGFGAWSLTGVYWKSNELSAMATLKLLGQEQQEFRERNGAYATLKELFEKSTRLPGELVRGAPPLYSGYFFQVFLPSGNVPAEGSSAKSPEARDHWCAYASPLRYGCTGHRAFFINESGELYAADNKSFSGDSMRPGAAYLPDKLFQEINLARWRPAGEKQP